MIDRLAAWLVYDLFGLDPASRLGTSVHFFFYDTVKIILLLIIIGTAMGIVNAYFPIERLRRFLSHRRLFGLQYLLAAGWGVERWVPWRARGLAAAVAGGVFLGVLVLAYRGTLGQVLRGGVPVDRAGFCGGLRAAAVARGAVGKRAGSPS